jgi:hypothetical protein
LVVKVRLKPVVGRLGQSRSSVVTVAPTAFALAVVDPWYTLSWRAGSWTVAACEPPGGTSMLATAAPPTVVLWHRPA